MSQIYFGSYVPPTTTSVTPVVNAGGGGGFSYRSLGAYLPDEGAVNDDQEVLEVIQIFLMIMDKD